MTVAAVSTRPIRGISTAGRVHLHACEILLWAYSVSEAVYKRWYIATALALMVTIALGFSRHISLRGAFRAMVPFVVYHVYLLTAIFRSEFRSLVAFNTIVDLIELPVVFLFWSLARNHPLSRIEGIFLRLPFVCAAATIFGVMTMGIGIRTGGLGVNLLPAAVPFCYEQLMRKHRPRLALLSLLLAFVILGISRSRSPFAAAVISLALSFLIIGKGLLARLKFMVVAGMAVAVLLGVMMFFAPTRYLLLSTYVRFSGNEINTPALWIPAEQPDIVREQLDDLVYELLPRVQPLGLGIGGASGEYARRYGEIVSVHNTYHAWAVEGGLVGVLIVLWIFVRFGGTLLRARRVVALRRFATALAIGTLAVLAMAMFHQMHRTPALWMLVGLGAGMRTMLVRGRRPPARAVIAPAPTPAPIAAVSN